MEKDFFRNLAQAQKISICEVSDDKLTDFFTVQ